MRDHTIRVLLIDGQVEDSRWVQELIAEFEESRFTAGWTKGIEIFPLERLGDALTVLDENDAKDQFDVVLLNPALPDSFGFNTFLRLQSHAPDIPVVILSEIDDPEFAASAVRAGAQDYLAKTQLDSAPLARSLRLAVERNRITRDLRAQTWRDELTGLLNRNGFDSIADRDIRTARALGADLAVAMVNLEGLDQIAFHYGREERRLAISEVADSFVESIGASASVARISASRFAAALPGADHPGVAKWLHTLRKRFQALTRKPDRNMLRVQYGVAWMAAGQADMVSVADLLASAAGSLCENMVDVYLNPLEKSSHRGNQLVHSARRDI